MNKQTSWDDQKFFLVVLEEGSFSAAARKLGVTQPTVRTRIEQLENQLGTVLFSRSVHGLKPTEHALALELPVRAMQRASDHFMRTASAPLNLIAGSVRVSVSEFLGTLVLPQMLTKFRSLYPEVNIEISLNNASANLLEQEVDLAIRMYPPVQEALVAKKVGEVPLGLYAHRDYIQRKGSPICLADLSQHDLIGPDRNLLEREMMRIFLPEIKNEQFKIRTDSHPAQFSAVKAALGVGFIQCPIANQCPELVQLLPDLEIQRYDLWLVIHEDFRQIPKIRALFDYLAQAFAEYLDGGS
ncbi:LysR family transcriptional regulator [Acinetobacter pittii]|uniref:LysR family transcriptional regulator n=1 Tax=Acinetobacter pittii TaxID=48296 RepID=UPI001CD29091|nr:LysR family transcriptional regulator [Acinetobacter pittii]